MLRSTLGAILALALLIPSPAEGQTHPASVALEHADTLQLTDAQRDRLQAAHDAWLESAEERGERMEAMRERMMEMDRQRMANRAQMRAHRMERRQGMMEVRDALTGEQFREYMNLRRGEMRPGMVRGDRMRMQRMRMQGMRGPR